MAVSGLQKTRIGGQVSGVGKKQTFTAKAAAIAVFKAAWAKLVNNLKGAGFDV